MLLCPTTCWATASCSGSVVFYTYVAIFYDLYLLSVYVVFFTLLNLYLILRTLESLALQLPRPVIIEEAEDPVVEENEEIPHEDFNEANLYRFQRINYWMQTHRQEWKDSTFGRDRLCQAVGFNRHLVLQSIRSQGFNNVHDYINSFRVAELKRMIVRGEAQTLKETLDAGFGTTKTVRTCFQQVEGISLDEFLARYQTPDKTEAQPTEE